MLGVGTALGMPAVAAADPEGSNTSSESSSESASNSSAPDGPAGSEGTAPSGPEQPSAPQSTIGSTPDTTDDDADEPTVGTHGSGATTASADDAKSTSADKRVHNRVTRSIVIRRASSTPTAEKPVAEKPVADEPTPIASTAQADVETDVADAEPATAPSKDTVKIVADVVSGVVADIMQPLWNPDRHAPAESPAAWALLAFARRESGHDTETSTETTLVARTTTSESVPEASVSALVAPSPAPTTSVNVAPVDPPLNGLHYTLTAIGNAFDMVLSAPVQVLLHPFTAASYVLSTVTRGLLTDAGVLPALPYANTGWVTLHGDPGNRKQQLDVELSEGYATWSALQGAGILAAPTVLPNGNVAVTTGLAAGRSNLHVVDQDGNVVWESTPWNGTDGVDSGAVLSSPIIDRAGNIYVSDGDQLWSFTQDGDVRWVHELPPPTEDAPLAPGSRNINPFITATLTNDGTVLGVTTYGQVVAVNGTTGELAAPIYVIPGPLAARAATNPPPTLWTGGYMDPEIIDPIWQVAFGGTYRTTNTPSVDSRTGRIFVAATAVEPGQGALYGIDYVPATPFGPGRIKVAFATQMGPGSGSSPTLSPDGRRVYASDDAGLLYAFDTRTGALIWTTDSNAEAASVAVDGTGNIYVLTRNDVMSSFDSNGNQRWLADVSELAAELPVNPVLGAPVAIGGGNPTIVDGAVVQAVVYGYNFTIPGRTIFLPVKATLVEFDPATGKAIRNVVATNEGTEGILNITPDGRMYASLGAITTTSVAPLASTVNPILALSGQTLLTPSGGFNGFVPLS